MKAWRILSIIILCMLVAGLAACGSGSQQGITQQLAEVKRGDLAITVNGGGNIEAGEDASLTFGVSGRIDKIFAEEGGQVNKGDILARLDTAALELALTQAQTGITQAQLGVTQAQLGVTQAETSLETAKLSLDRMEDVAEANDEITEAEYEIKATEANLQETIRFGNAETTEYWQDMLEEAQARLVEAQLDLAELLAEAEYTGLMVDELEIKKLLVKAAEESLEVTRKSLGQAEQAVGQAEQAEEYARKQLEDATITATFDGLVAMVSADTGDTVSPATPIIYLVDPGSMQLKVEVDEIDIPLIELGQRVNISVDALPDRQFEGEIASVSLLPKIEAGIVSYEVTISLSASDDALLKIGMSATADIMAEHRENALLVPSKAITVDNQGNTTVQVMANGQAQTRTVVTGISDFMQTEIISGLQEGDTVILEANNGEQDSNAGLFF